MEENGQFVVLMEEQSYLTNAFKGAFDKQNVKVKIVDSAEAATVLAEPDTRGLLVCTSEELLKRTSNVKAVVDTAIRREVPVFIMGNSDELRTLLQVLPKQMIQGSFARPIVMGEMVENIFERLEKIEKTKKKTILAVDDSGVILRNVKTLLEDKYQVILANSGTMAIKYLALNTPDLILLDYEMPIVDGKQVMQMLREDAEFQKIPIIFLTGKNDSETVMKVMELKPDGYLLKTMEPKKLHAAIDDFMEKQEI